MCWEKDSGQNIVCVPTCLHTVSRSGFGGYPKPFNLLKDGAAKSMAKRKTAISPTRLLGTRLATDDSAIKIATMRFILRCGSLRRQMCTNTRRKAIEDELKSQQAIRVLIPFQMMHKTTE